MRATIEVRRFERGNQGAVYLYGTIEREIRYTTLRSSYVGCATGPIFEQRVSFVFLGRARFKVEPDAFRPIEHPYQISLTSDFVIPASVDRLITKVEKVLR